MKIDVFERPLPATPIVRLSGRYDAGQDNEIYIKREDLIPFSFGGNKARKAAYFYQEIQREKPDVIMTYGSNSSNHCRIIANLAAALGLPCHIISVGEEEHGRDGRQLFNRMLVQQFGAVVETVPVERVHDTIEERLQAFRRAGRKPYFIQGGGHGRAGTQSYVDAFCEIRQQEKEMGITFSRIFHASGTGSTQAGLVCGKEQCGTEHEIVGISIARDGQRGREVVKQSILDYLGRHRELFREEDLIFVDSYRQGGYGKFTPAEEECLRSVMRQDGIPMDTTYVGKAFYGMLQYLRAGGIHGERILFLHTGGTPLFFDRL